MSIENPIADMLTRIRNAQAAKMKQVSMLSSKVIVSIAEVLKKEGYISDFSLEEIDKSKKSITIELKYYQGLPVIEKIRQVSKPSVRVYSQAKKLQRVRDGLGMTVVSTSKGVMASTEARHQGLGGEVLLEVY